MSVNLFIKNFSDFHWIACHNYNRKQVVEAARSAIQTCDAVLNLYNEMIDHFGTSDVTRKTVQIIGDLKTRLTTGIDLYEKSPKPIADWCVQTTSLLTTYKNGGTKDNVITALNEAVTVANNAYDGLAESKRDINVAGGNLFTLERYLAQQFDENAKYIMDAQSNAIKTQLPELKKKVESIREFLEDFACTQDKVQLAFMDIGKIKVVAETARVMVSMDDVEDIHSAVIESADRVVEQCNKYREKYE